MAPQDLSGLLTPFDTDAFLKTCWSQRFLHVPGASGKFADLLPWPALNRILEQHRLEPPRMRLTREGHPVPSGFFLSYANNRRRANQPIPRLRSADLQRELRNGATLVLDAVDELHEPVTALAESLERQFRVRIQVNAYAGWRTSHGFDLHWDDHDVFILQVAGRKQWKVYGMTRKYPLTRDVEPALDRPETPLWEGMLEDGDFLYIPRGWWHVATPLDEPTLHLTVGINNPTGADLLNWFVDRLRVHEELRRDLPLFGCEEQQTEALERMRNLLIEAWSPELLREYMAGLDARSQPRPHMNLPWGATREALPAEFHVRWNVNRPAPLERFDGEVQCIAHGRRWRFAAAAEPLLERLHSGRHCSSNELIESVSDTLDPKTVRTFLRELVENGLIAVI